MSPTIKITAKLKNDLAAHLGKSRGEIDSMSNEDIRAEALAMQEAMAAARAAVRETDETAPVETPAEAPIVAAPAPTTEPEPTPPGGVFGKVAAGAAGLIARVVPSAAAPTPAAEPPAEPAERPNGLEDAFIGVNRRAFAAAISYWNSLAQDGLMAELRQQFARISTLEQLNKDLRAHNAELQRRVGHLEAEAVQLRNTNAELQGLNQKRLGEIAELRRQIDQLLARPVPQQVDLAPLVARLDQIEQALQSQRRIGNSLETLAQKVEQILAAIAHMEAADRRFTSVPLGSTMDRSKDQPRPAEPVAPTAPPPTVGRIPPEDDRVVFWLPDQLPADQQSGPTAKPAPPSPPAEVAGGFRPRKRVLS